MSDTTTGGPAEQGEGRKLDWAKRAGSQAALIDRDTMTEVAYVWRFGPQMGSVWYAGSWEHDGIIRLGGGKGYGVEWAKRQLWAIIEAGEWDAHAQMADV